MGERGEVTEASLNRMKYLSSLYCIIGDPGQRGEGGGG